MSAPDEDLSWLVQQMLDEEQQTEDFLNALLIAERSGTPHETVQLLAYGCGVGDLYNKEQRQ